MTPKEKQAAKESIRKGIEIYKKDLKYWQDKKKEAEGMIAHDKKRIQEEQEKLKAKYWK